MANWDKLNKQFDNFVDNMSAEDWIVWAKNREKRRAMRALELELKAKIQQEKLYLSTSEGICFTPDINSKSI